MCGSRSFRQRLRRCLLGGLVAPGLLAAVADSWAGPPDSRPSGLLTPVLVTPVAANVQPAMPVVDAKLDLAACKALALQKQPAVAAAHASLAAAIARQQALENLCVPTFLQRDLPKRRQQAALGVQAAQASVLLAEIDTLYAVQFAYVSYLYAQEQNRLADKTLQSLKDKKLLAPFASRADARQKAAGDKLEALAWLVEGRKQEAVVGIQRALSSLREAIGLDGECLALRDAMGLPDPRVNADCESVVHLALSHRPEIIQASIGTEVFDLEVAAQKSRRLALSVWTFAAGSDLHATPLPSGVFGPGYRPGVVGPEMPVTINGKRCDRVEQAEIYKSRSYSVLEKTQKLIRLETEQAFYRWKEAGAKLARFTQGAEKARNSLDWVMSKESDLVPENFRLLTHYLDTARLLTDLRYEVNRSRYEMLLALIALERATAGGVCADLDHAPIVSGLPSDTTPSPEKK